MSEENCSQRRGNQLTKRTEFQGNSGHGADKYYQHRHHKNSTCSHLFHARAGLLLLLTILSSVLSLGWLALHTALTVLYQPSKKYFGCPVSTKAYLLQDVVTEKPLANTRCQVDPFA
jgi:hypothetical protein